MRLDDPKQWAAGAFSFAVPTITGLTAASSWIPWKLGQQGVFGQPALEFDYGPDLYWPWRIIEWAYRYSADIPNTLDTAKLIAAAGVAAGCFTAFKAITASPGKHAFGKYEWGDRRYARRLGILPEMPEGIVLGKWRDGTIVSHSGPEHVLVTGASRSGKTITVVIPTLLTWRESVFVYDPKRELFETTAKWRSTFSDTFYVDFTDPRSARYNPMSEIRVGTRYETADIQALAEILMDPADNPHARPSYWEKDGQALFTQVMRHMVRAFPQEKRNFGEMRRRTIVLQPLLEEMMKSEDEDVRLVAEKFDAMNPDQKQGVEAEAGTALNLYADPLVRDLASCSEFTLSDLVCGKRPVSCYLQVTPDQARRLRPLVRMMMMQLTQSLIWKQSIAGDGRKKKHTLLCLYEEFPEVGRVPAVERQLALSASYKFRFLLVMQTKNSLDKNYPDGSIMANCPVRVAFPSTVPEENEALSKLIGTGVEYRESESTPKQAQGWFGKGGSKTLSRARRPLLDAGEIRSMDSDEQFVIITPGKPMKTKKLRWFDEPFFAERGTNERVGDEIPDQNPRFGRELPKADRPIAVAQASVTAAKRKRGRPAKVSAVQQEGE